MADEWIKWTKGLSRKREVLAIADRLSLDRRIVAAACMEFWEWADSETIDGTFVPFVSRTIDDIVRIPGFADVLLSPEIGWLEPIKNGVRIPNYDRHNGTSSKKRALEARKKRNQRASRECPRNVPEMSPEVRDQRKRKSKRKNKEEKDIPPAAVVRPRNPVFDAIADLSGLDPATAGSQIGKAAATLSKADPPYTAEDVQAFGRRFPELCPYSTRDGRTRPTVGEIEKYIGLLRAKPAPAVPARPASSDDRLARDVQKVLGMQ